jgi:hypothetical protein
VKGVRDVASGLMTSVLIAERQLHVLAGFLLAATVILCGRRSHRAPSRRSQVNGLRGARSDRSGDGRYRRDPARMIIPLMPCALIYQCHSPAAAIASIAELTRSASEQTASS